MMSFWRRGICKVGIGIVFSKRESLGELGGMLEQTIFVCQSRSTMFGESDVVL